MAADELARFDESLFPALTDAHPLSPLADDFVCGTNRCQAAEVIPRRYGMPTEMLPGRGVLDAELEGEETHGGPQAVPPVSVKSASSGIIPTARSHFVPDFVVNNKGNASTQPRRSGRSFNEGEYL